MDRAAALVVRIDRLVLDGVDAHDAVAVRRVVEIELRRLLLGRGLPPGAEQLGERTRVGTDLPGPPASTDEALGAQIARRVYDGLGG